MGDIVTFFVVVSTIGGTAFFFYGSWKIGKYLQDVTALWRQNKKAKRDNAVMYKT